MARLRKGQVMKELLGSSPALKVQQNKAKLNFEVGTTLLRSSPVPFSQGVALSYDNL